MKGVARKAAVVLCKDEKGSAGFGLKMAGLTIVALVVSVVVAFSWDVPVPRQEETPATSMQVDREEIGVRLSGAEGIPFVASFDQYAAVDGAALAFLGDRPRNAEGLALSE